MFYETFFSPKNYIAKVLIKYTDLLLFIYELYTYKPTIASTKCAYGLCELLVALFQEQTSACF